MRKNQKTNTTFGGTSQGADHPEDASASTARHPLPAGSGAVSAGWRMTWEEPDEVADLFNAQALRERQEAAVYDLPSEAK